jgi:hypothetical protein
MSFASREAGRQARGQRRTLDAIEIGERHAENDKDERLKENRAQRRQQVWHHEPACASLSSFTQREHAGWRARARSAKLRGSGVCAQTHRRLYLRHTQRLPESGAVRTDTASRPKLCASTASGHHTPENFRNPRHHRRRESDILFVPERVRAALVFTSVHRRERERWCASGTGLIAERAGNCGILAGRQASPENTRRCVRA